MKAASNVSKVPSSFVAARARSGMPWHERGILAGQCPCGRGRRHANQRNVMPCECSKEVQ